MLNFTQDMEETMDKDEDFLIANRQDRIIYFQHWIEELHAGGLTYIESIVDFCDQHDVEYESITKLISESMKLKIYEEAISLNQIKRKSDDVNAIFL